MKEERQENRKIPKKKPLELYVHIPFCVRKCAYCDFLSAPAAKEEQRAYVESLLAEIQKSAGLAESYRVSTVFFGGGTPSILEAEETERILTCLREIFDFSEGAEITIEANPGTVDADRLSRYQRSGINRISFGLQSADNTELRTLGRIHMWEDFLESYHMARDAGFQNINIDLMSALPGQSTKSWRRTLFKAAELAPEHISAYSLIVEEGTPFYERYAGHPEALPSEEEERQMYYDTRDILSEYGYERYEISNYAKKGRRCRHNLGYWDRTDYKGYGLGAASLLDNVRTSNQTDLAEYLRGNTAGTRECLTEQAIREEYFFLGLRKTEGIYPGRYEEHYRELLEKLTGQQLLIREADGKIRLTDRGIDVSNYVLAQFLT